MEGGSLGCRDSRGWDTWCFPWTKPLQGHARKECPWHQGGGFQCFPCSARWIWDHLQTFHHKDRSSRGTRGLWFLQGVSMGHPWPRRSAQPHIQQSLAGRWSLRAALSLCRFANSPVECSYALELLIRSDFALSSKAPEVKQILI